MDLWNNNYLIKKLMFIHEIDKNHKLTDFIIEFDGYNFYVKYKTYILWFIPIWEIITDNNENNLIFKTKEEAINFINFII